jgi:pyruvate,orthophosphate dikinase
VPAEGFEQVLTAHRAAAGVRSDAELSAADLRHLVEEFKKVFHQHTGFDFPQDSWEQLIQAIRAVFASWNTPRAMVYRRQEHIAGDLGTAVTVMAMVFGNRGPDSGTGVAFTRDPATGARGVYGDYLRNAQGEDVVAGVRNTTPLQELERLDKRTFDELIAHMSTLERHYRDLCDIEFTTERGRLWMLQTRVGNAPPRRRSSSPYNLSTRVSSTSTRRCGG